MTHYRGFSLLELLISLILVTTIALALLSQLVQTKLLTTQLLLRSSASRLFEKTEEMALIGRTHLNKSHSL